MCYEIQMPTHFYTIMQKISQQENQWKETARIILHLMTLILMIKQF